MNTFDRKLYTKEVFSKSFTDIEIIKNYKLDTILDHLTYAKSFNKPLKTPLDQYLGLTSTDYIYFNQKSFRKETILVLCDLIVKEKMVYGIFELQFDSNNELWRMILQYARCIDRIYYNYIPNLEQARICFGDYVSEVLNSRVGEVVYELDLTGLAYVYRENEEDTMKLFYHRIT